MNDIAVSIKAFLYDRSVSPLAGAFCVSWLLWNYRVLMILLADIPLEQQFSEIDRYFRPIDFSLYHFAFQIEGELINGVAFPLIISLFYLFIYPLVAKPVYEYSLTCQKALRQAKERALGEKLLTIDESRELTRRMLDSEARYESRITNLRTRISQLTEENDELRKENKELLPGERELKPEEILRMAKIDIARKLIEAFSTKPPGSYRIMEIMDWLGWGGLNDDQIEDMASKVKNVVERGDIPGVAQGRGGSIEHQTYRKLDDKNSVPKQMSLAAKRMLGELNKSPEADGIAVDRLATDADIDPRYITETIQELHDKGLVNVDGVGGKTKKLSLTKRGEDFLLEESGLTEA